MREEVKDFFHDLLTYHANLKALEDERREVEQRISTSRKIIRQHEDDAPKNLEFGSYVIHAKDKTYYFRVMERDAEDEVSRFAILGPYELTTGYLFFEEKSSS